MLNLWLGKYCRETPIPINKTDNYFDNYFDRECLTSDFARGIISDIMEGSTVFDKNVIIHPRFGALTHKQLPTGIKTVLVTAYDSNVMTNLTYCGDNCLPYLISIGRERDITTSSTRFLDLFWENDYHPDYEIRIMNEDVIVNNFDDYMRLRLKYVDYEIR